MAPHAEHRIRSYATPLLGVVVVTGSLYLAREVLIPLALAVLFSALLAPAVRRLEALRIGRAASTLISVGLFIAALALVGWAAANQVLSLAGKIPEFKDNIAAKLRTLHSPPKGDLGKAAKAIKELEREGATKGEGAPRREEAPPKKPARVEVPTTPLDAIRLLGVPVLTLLAMAAAVIVITTLMLLKKDDLRDRLIRLVGERQIHLTTQAIEDAAGRISRYLLMQVLVNASYAIPLAIALHLIGLPNALLFGLLAMVLRFVPYLGAAVAAALPIALAFAISGGWETIAWTVAVIAALEFTVAYVIEPWIYGESTGLSPIAIVFSAIFWTWLWGPIGLLLATPLTVCASVVGRHIPQFGFLHVILGAQQVLPAPVRFYQRLVAMEYDEALDMAEEFAREHDLAALYDQVLLPALLLAKRDHQREALDDERERFIVESLQRMVEELEIGARREAEQGAAPAPASGPPICIAAAHDDMDHVAGLMLARLLAPERYQALLLPRQALVSELLEHVAGTCEDAVCVSSVPPSAASNASYLCKRLRQRFPKQKIVAALWHAEGDLERARRRLLAAGADEVVTTLPEALEKIRLVAPLQSAS